MTAPVFLVPAEALDGAAIGAAVRLDGTEGRHAVAVRRLAVGEAIILTDGQGAGISGVVASVEGKDVLTVEVAAVLSEAEPKPKITVVQALPKGDRGELAVETMTEVGVDVIVPWAAARCVTQWKGERGAKSLAKWRATAREAGKQARRLRFPEVTDLVTTRQVGALLGEAALPVVLHEEGSEPLATVPVPAEGEIVIVVGPEGGIAPAELEAFAGVGAKPCRLGASVLRTSTAGVAAGALLLGRTGRWH